MLKVFSVEEFYTELLKDAQKTVDFVRGEGETPNLREIATGAVDFAHSSLPQRVFFQRIDTLGGADTVIERIIGDIQ
jgi:hypothetical protein